MAKSKELLLLQTLFVIGRTQAASTQRFNFQKRFTGCEQVIIIVNFASAWSSVMIVGTLKINHATRAQRVPSVVFDSLLYFFWEPIEMWEGWRGCFYIPIRDGRWHQKYLICSCGGWKCVLSERNDQNITNFFLVLRDSRITDSRLGRIRFRWFLAIVSTSSSQDSSHLDWHGQK